MDQLEASIALIGDHSVTKNRAVALNRVRAELENTSLLAIKVKNEVERTELKLGGDLEQMKTQLGREKQIRVKFEQEAADYETKTASQLAKREEEIAALREKLLESSNKAEVDLLKEKIGLLTEESRN